MYRKISKEELIESMTGSRSRKEVLIKLKLPVTGTANKFVKELLEQYELKEKDFYVYTTKDCLVNRVSPQELQDIINTSSTYREVLEKLGYENAVGSAYRTLKDYIKRHNLDTSNLTHKAKIPFKPNRDEDVFCVNSKVTQSCLRNRVLKGNLIPYVCAICGQPPEWQGKPLTLTLDHKNGNRTDNRLENLQFVCPNCDHQ